MLPDGAPLDCPLLSQISLEGNDSKRAGKSSEQEQESRLKSQESMLRSRFPWPQVRPLNHGHTARGSPRVASFEDASRPVTAIQPPH